MTRTTASVTLWAPRLAAIAMSLFLALFALDAFSGRSIIDGLPGFVVHAGPALLVLAIVGAAWRYPLAGAAAFAVLAVAYAVTVQSRLDWIVAISGPLAAVALLFFVSWWLAPAQR